MNMSSGLKFYEARSLESLKVYKGLRKISFTCSGDPSKHCFIWLDTKQQIKQIQFLFNEMILEWVKGKGIQAGETNRIQLQGMRFAAGHQKGIRTFNKSRDQEISSMGTQLLKNAQFPEDIKDKILECLTQKELDNNETLETFNENNVKPHFHYLIQSLPINIFRVIAGADMVIDDKEINSFEHYIMGIKKFKSMIGDLVRKEIQSDSTELRRRISMAAAVSIDNTLALIREACKMLEKHVVKEISDEWKRELLEMALQIAQASGGVMGIGSVASVENKMLVKLEEIFKVKQKNTKTKS